MSEASLIELYRFVEGTTVFTQARCSAAVVYGGETYDPYSLSRTQVESKNEMARANLDITMAIDNPVAMRYLASPVDSVVTLSLFVQANGITNVFWKGRLSNVKATGQTAILSFESIFTSLRRPGLRARYQRTCRHALYGRGCGLDPEAFGVDVMVTAVAPNQVTVTDISGTTLNRFRGGMIRAPDTTLRFVVGSDPATGIITLTRNFDTLNAAFLAGGSVPMAATLYPGCAHNMGACLEFDNLDNFGGFPFIPTKNPMAGSAIT